MDIARVIQTELLQNLGEACPVDCPELVSCELKDLLCFEVIKAILNNLPLPIQRPR